MSLKTVHVCALTFFLLSLFATESFSSTARNIQITCDQWPSRYSFQDFAQDAFRLTDAQTKEEKALALFRFIRMWTSATDGNVPREPALGDTYIDDPLKVMNVYGAHHIKGKKDFEHGPYPVTYGNGVLSSGQIGRYFGHPGHTPLSGQEY